MTIDGALSAWQYVWLRNLQFSLGIMSSSWLGMEWCYGGENMKYQESFLFFCTEDVCVTSMSYRPRRSCGKIWEIAPLTHREFEMLECLSLSDRFLRVWNMLWCRVTPTSIHKKEKSTLSHHKERGHNTKRKEEISSQIHFFFFRQISCRIPATFCAVDIHLLQIGNFEYT